MPIELSEDERKYIDKVFRREKENRFSLVFSYIILFLGVALIVSTFFFLHQYSINGTIYCIGLPRILLGVLLIILYVLSRKEEKEIKILSSILKKLTKKE